MEELSCGVLMPGDLLSRTEVEIKEWILGRDTFVLSGYAAAYLQLLWYFINLCNSIVWDRIVMYIEEQ
jgi:hypothetical protein